MKCYPYNFKITTNEDIEIFEAMLNRNAEQVG